MELGVHLPLMSFPGVPVDPGVLPSLVAVAEDRGLAAVAANDHLVFGTPWLDGPTALASIARQAGDLELMTTVALPTIRGPVATAKLLVALDLLADGGVVAGVGPGSSARDHAAVGIDFDDRWPRFEAAVGALRALLDGTRVPESPYYDLADEVLLPRPRRRVPLWIGSWGSDAGLRRVARRADGWLASAYNTDPDAFMAARARLDDSLEAEGRDPAQVRDGLSTGFLRLTDTRAEADRFVAEVLSPALRRAPSELRERVFVGPLEDVVELSQRYMAAGLQRLLLWPVGHESEQLEAFVDAVYAPASV